MQTPSQAGGAGAEDTFGKRFGRSAEAAAPVASPPVSPAVAPLVAEHDNALAGVWVESANGASATFASGMLYVLACLVGGLGILGGLVRLHAAAVAPEGVSLVDGLTVAGWIIGGVAMAALLIGVAGQVGALSRLRRQLREQANEFAALAQRIERLGHLAVDPQTLTRLDDRLTRLGESLMDVAQNSLLDEAGRAQKRRQLADRQRDEALEQIRREMADGQWDRARGAIERLRMNFPRETDSIRRLSEELERRRQQAEAEDVASARRQCEEMMSVSAWDRAVSLAQELLQKHPDSTAAKALLARIDRERKVAQEQQRQTLYAQIQRHTSRRQWAEALTAAQRLIELFPQCIEAEAVKAQMGTLQANAEIQHRQKVELAIMDLVKRQRYTEAVELAETLVRDYPGSPQAGALRRKLPQLKERAETAAREARKRRVQWS